MASTSKPKEGKGKWKDKYKSQKNDVLCTNTPNCGRCGHTKDKCWEKGGGKEGQAPDWWKKSKDKKASANSAEAKTDEKDEPENYAMLAFTIPIPNDQTALVCTSDFRDEAHAASNQSGIIIDSGASCHFSLDHPKFLNFKEFVNKEPIRAADGRTFHALGKGDIQIRLPNGKQGSTLITLKEVYYSPIMAFTLVSVSCVDRAGFSLIIGGGICEIKTSKSKVIGCIPEICCLYRIQDSKLLSPQSTQSARANVNQRASQKNGARKH